MFGTSHTKRGRVFAQATRRTTWLVATVVCIGGAVLVLSHSGAQTAGYGSATVKPTLLELPPGHTGLYRSNSRVPAVTPASSMYDRCIQDDTDRSMILQFNSTTRPWQFTKCDQPSPILLIGTGTLSIPGCPSLSGRSGASTVTASLMNACTYGTAYVTYNYAPGSSQIYRLTDSNTGDDTCSTIPAA